MAKNPSTVWYWNDSENEKLLTTCSMAAQGLWQRMLAVMATATPRGYLKLGDKPCSIGDLARITNQDKRAVSKWLHELERRAVFSRTEDGTIFCRRMVREAEKRRPRVSDKRKSNANPRHPHRDANQPELFDNPEKTRTRPRAPSSSGSFATSQDSPSADRPESPAPREVEKYDEGNPEEGRVAPLGDLVERIAAKTRMPARLADRHRDGECDEQASQAPASDYRDLARERQDHDPPIAGGGQSATVDLSRRGLCRRTGKSPALRAKIRDQLVQKCARFLVDRRRPDELARYWAAQLGDDPAAAQRMLDETDRRMRAARWDDMREWRARHGIAA